MQEVCVGNQKSTYRKGSGVIFMPWEQMSRKTSRYEDLGWASKDGWIQLDRHKWGVQHKHRKGGCPEALPSRGSGRRGVNLKCNYSIDIVQLDLCLPQCCDEICELLINGRLKNILRIVLLKKLEQHCDKHPAGVQWLLRALMHWWCVKVPGAITCNVSQMCLTPEARSS